MWNLWKHLFLLFSYLETICFIIFLLKLSRHIMIIVFMLIIIFDKVKKGPLISPGGVQSSHESHYISGVAGWEVGGGEERGVATKHWGCGLIMVSQLPLYQHCHHSHSHSQVTSTLLSQSTINIVLANPPSSFIWRMILTMNAIQFSEKNFLCLSGRFRSFIGEKKRKKITSFKSPTPDVKMSISWLIGLRLRLFSCPSLPIEWVFWAE